MIFCGAERSARAGLVIDVLAQQCADVATVLRHWGADAVGVAVAKAVDDGSVITSRGPCVIPTLLLENDPAQTDLARRWA